ncbi:hypothetical protein Maes01_00605 [Microbulbifer aestuariivivens]|uniref:DUF5011 domain-containing protein n=1 Tax=Microbulbifer aestuariivivens TaxID=1908308 RepID=A0ABP9WN62_9GAMM
MLKKVIRLALLPVFFGFPLFASANDTLLPDKQLTSNQYLVSRNGDYRITLQRDGNFVLRDWSTRKALWASSTHNTAATRIRLQSDGNLVLRNASGQAVWSSKTHNQAVTMAVIENDGNFVLYAASGEALWETATSQIPTDTVAPVITLLGNQSITLDQGDSFSDPGATANDNEDGDLTAAITVSGSVNTSQAGIYTLRYDVSDTAGNAANTLTRSVEVVADTIKPVITLLGRESITLDQGDTFNDAGATASDNKDGDLTAAITVSGAVNTSQAGIYTLRYDVNDAAGNAANTVTRSVEVIADTVKPVITLRGRESITLDQGDTFNDAGATASDNKDGDLTAAITVSGAVNTSQAGIYTLRYDVSDAAGNAANTVTRTINVIADTVKPVITLLGSASTRVVQGEVFTDPGATALDNKDGDITHLIAVSGAVNTSRLGTYTLVYGVSDAAGNRADSVTRSIEVAAPPPRAWGDTLATGQQLVTNEHLTSSNGEYVLYMQTDGNVVLRDTATRSAIWATGTSGSGAIRLRLQSDGNLVMRDADGKAVWSSRTDGTGADRLTLQDDGDLVLRDSNGNTVWASGTAQQPPDTVKPVITLLGASSIVLSQGDGFTDAGATASDDIDGDITPSITVAGAVNSDQPGNYAITYHVQDAAGNNADPVSRFVTVLARNDDSGDDGNNGATPEITAKSRGIFSAPDAALYSLNDSRASAFPKIIDSGFEGNGHAETWDGRIFVRKRKLGWYASAFRPERITRNADGSINFKNGAFGSSVELQSKADADARSIHQNWLAIAQDFSVEGRNPFPSDAAGNYSSLGTYATYKALVYVTSTAAGDNDQMGFFRATFIVANANTRDAQVVSARFNGGFQRLRLKNSEDFRCIEPSVTVNGMLIVCQGHPDNNGRIDNLVYSWNPAPGAASGWSLPKSIANMYWDDRDTDVAGVKFSMRFPIAERPLVDATGNAYGPNELVKGAYPWVSHDGAELFYQASREGVSARRTATTVVGRWTGWTFRHIDGPINPNRHRDTRLFISSPGAFTTMWSPYKNVDDLKMPYSLRGPGYPIFGSNNHDYSEVGFNDYLDGNFILYYGMNEQVDRSGAFQKTGTNDTSGNFNNGTLVNAKFPLEYNGQDVLAGRFGQAIYFPSGSYVEVDKNRGWDSLGNGATVDFWLNMASSSGSIPLFSLSGGVEISLADGDTLVATVTDTAGETETLIGGGIANNSWQHIALAVDPAKQQMLLYLNGRLVADRALTNFGTLRTDGAVRLGPQNANALLLLDEVKVSNVAREAHEISHYAHVSSHKAASGELLANIPAYLQPLRFNATGVDRFSNRAADLGAKLFVDTILSRERTTACSTCHNPNQAFTDGKKIAQGNESTDDGRRNSPTLHDRLFSTMQGWSGEAKTLDTQALIPIAAPHEMNLPVDEAVQRLQANSSYRDQFLQVYGQLPNAENIALALASVQATLFSPKNRVDDHLAGDSTALTESEKRGLDLFNGKARCSGCHSGVNYTDESFRNNGLTVDSDFGRADVTNRDRDFRLFKVPTLRQLGETAPYMHDGSMANLEAVVRAYNAGALSVADKDTDIRPLELSEQEIADLLAFLQALTN